MQNLIMEFFMNDLSVHIDISNMLVLRVAVGLPVRESLKPDGTIKSIEIIPPSTPRVSLEEAKWCTHAIIVCIIYLHEFFVV